jgi:tryptophan-rich sensory protein
MSLRREHVWKPVAVAALAAAAVAALGVSATDLGPWYYGLRKPSWQPPDWLFGPAWTLIYALVAMAGVFAWRGARDGRLRAKIITFFGANALVNVLWSELFFHFQRPDLALGEVVVFWLSILALIFVVQPASSTASLLLVPYIAWVTFAAALNLAVVRLNAPFR